MPLLGYGLYKVDPAEGERCISDAIAAGYRLIDTAQYYGNEECVGRAIVKSGIPREEFFIVTKIWIDNSGEEKAYAALQESWGSPVLVANVVVRKPGQVNNPNLLTMSAYAEGGRATEASIFGEAGPEWAIPEEHTDRVAALLNSARQAAGFTWPELITRNGGLNAGGHTPVQIVYSPVIYANDATGVAEKLREDKERLERWMEERRLRDEVEVFA